MGVRQIQVRVGFGQHWQLTPEITWKVVDDTGLGEVTRTRAEMRQSDVRSWKRPQQKVALRAVVATCVLAVLPTDYLGRTRLADAAAAGHALLPSRLPPHG